MPKKQRRLSFAIQDELYGKITDKLDPAERWAWMALRMWCGNSPHQPYVCSGMLHNRTGWTDRQLAIFLNIPKRLWRRTKNKLFEMLAIEVDENNIIKINNWEKWQEDRWRVAQDKIKREYEEMYAKDKHRVD